MGHLTGTTVLKSLKALKFAFLDEAEDDEEDATRLFLQGTLGLKMNRKTEAQLAGVQLATLKKAYKALGFRHNSRTTREEMMLAVKKQHPSNALVFQKIVTPWCMTPIKRKKRCLGSF
jgi:hypothetical protein